MEGSANDQKDLEELEVRSKIEEKLVESGEKEKLIDLLRKRLIESGWRDQLKKHCQEIIKAKGTEKITIEDLVKDIMPRGKATVPEKVKEEIMEKLAKFL
eukprot:CAMPEP_0167803086 /NCGR_PEP_ID=MMETSP0111_2-20121227/19564_1 /TAXON_ID=91324 /ORGANISM="Lotharella globosa, Strain CCCM811" /LENGTH=99 /DNA_ID=CAMNT_0007699363 /DNA_START=14 /DNA_END=310 /DNA_ORIENTATION=+